MRQIVQLLRSKGAAEVHVRISSPPIGHACYYGIDISDKTELIANARSIESICSYIEADSLAYLSTEAMLRTVEDGSRYCTACFTGDYPGPVPLGFRKIGF
jgi:amidophosphoribosyltransferase